MTKGKKKARKRNGEVASSADPHSVFDRWLTATKNTPYRLSRAASDEGTPIAESTFWRIRNRERKDVSKRVREFIEKYSEGAVAASIW